MWPCADSRVRLLNFFHKPSSQWTLNKEKESSWFAKASVLDLLFIWWTCDDDNVLCSPYPGRCTAASKTTSFVELFRRDFPSLLSYTTMYFFYFRSGNCPYTTFWMCVFFSSTVRKNQVISLTLCRPALFVSSSYPKECVYPCWSFYQQTFLSINIVKRCRPTFYSFACTNKIKFFFNFYSPPKKLAKLASGMDK